MGNYYAYPGTPAVTQIAGPYNMACEFSVLEPSWLTSVGVRRPSTSQVATVTCRLYRMTGPTTGVQVGSDFTGTPSGSTWYNITPPAPIPLSRNETYRIVCRFPDFGCKIDNYFTSGPGASGLGNGLLVVPNRANTLNLAQNAFNADASLTLPISANANGPSYLLDPNITDVDPAAGTPGTAIPIYGTDVSSAYGPVDLAVMRDAGMQFVIPRLGQGGGDNGNAQLIDSQWITNRDAARSLSLPMMAYWYYGGSESASSQASRALAAIGDASIPICIDWEEGGGSWDTFVAGVAAFRAAGLTVPMIYSRYTWYMANGGRSIAALNVALWNSRYPVVTAGTPAALYGNVSSDRATYWQTYGGVTTKFLQYSSNATIGSYTAADADAFNGSLAELNTLMASTPPNSAAFLPFFPDRVKAVS